MRPYYQNRGITIYCGDNREILPCLSPVDIVMGDPPYSEDVHSKVRAGARKTPLHFGDGKLYPASLARAVDLGFDHLSPEDMRLLAREAARLARRWILYFSDAESIGDWKRELRMAGAEWCRTLQWRKLRTTPQFSGDRPASPTESIAAAYARGPHARRVRGKSYWNGGGHVGYYVHPVVLNGKGRARRVHKTQKPIELMLELVRDFADIGETILDPTMGSGTTLHAALRLGCNAIGIEREEAHCEAAARRIEAEPHGLSRFDYASARASLPRSARLRKESALCAA